MISRFHSSKFILIYLVFVLILFVSCNQNKIIEEEKFVQIYTDIIIEKDTTSEIGQAKDTMLKNILNKYNVNLDQYKSTVQYYNQDSERWEKFFTKAVTYLEKKRQDASK